MNKFWNWVRNEDTGSAELIFNGPISEDTWFGDEITPAMFRNELAKVSGDLTVWLNSPGGDVFAASQIYTMLRNHKGKVTVKIDGIAASAASVVAMAGDETLIAPTGMLMIHNPSTVAFGNKEAMQKAIELLDEVKESIINAYEEKSGLSRSKIARMMDEETWLNAKKAQSLGLVDGILFASGQPQPKPEEEPDEEVLEVEEGFAKGQKGSSAMPHKKNPIASENLCGLARVVKSNSITALDNVALWHERDISHSSAERIILSDSCILVDFMLNRFSGIVKNLVVIEKNMAKNADSYGGIIYSQKVLLRLVEKGLTRENAYRLVQRNALCAMDNDGSFRENLLKDTEITALMSEAEILECFDRADYLKNISKIFERFV